MIIDGTDLILGRMASKVAAMALSGEEVTISSVDAITYKYESWGDHPSAGFAGTFYFQIDPETNVITYPESYNGEDCMLNDFAITCLARNPNDLANVAAMVSTPDIAIKEFYLLLEKK